MGKELGASCLAQLNGLVGCLRYVCKQQIGPDDNSGPPLSRMTVDQNFVISSWPSLNNDVVHYLANIDCSFVGWSLQVLPIEIVILNTLVHQQLRVVTETNFGDDAVAAVRVLSWFLEVEHSFNIFLFELS